MVIDKKYICKLNIFLKISQLDINIEYWNSIGIFYRLIKFSMKFYK